MFDRLIQAVLSEEVGHVPVQLEKIPNACVLYRSVGAGNALPSTRHAWRLARSEGDGVCTTTTSGLADRYGGSGIGRNGGSGRNVVIGKVQIKGVGRTTLVSPETPASHASGGAYLEECMREAIFSGVVAHDFPYGAIPVQEILDTGECQSWPDPIQPAQERRVLLVRPLFVRPAHFERALGFDFPRRQQARADHDRVAAVLERSASILGADAFVTLLDNFWPKWAHQLAYGFVHRLSHGNDTSSNISVDVGQCGIVLLPRPGGDAQRVRLDLLEPTPMEHVAWPLAKLWEREPPDSVRLLRGFLQPLIGRSLREDCQQTHARLSRTRSELFKPHLRQSIFQAIDLENDGHFGATPSFVQAFVDGHITRGLRERAPAAADPTRVIASFVSGPR